MVRGFLSSLKNIAALAACRPALATDRARPEAARAHVRRAIFDRDGVVGAWAPVIVRVVSCGVAAALGIRTRAEGVGGQSHVSGADAPPCEGVSIVVEDAMVKMGCPGGVQTSAGSSATSGYGTLPRAKGLKVEVR